MNFIILGAGAIGCYVGGRLAHAGQNVTLVGRPRVIDALAVHGLTVTDLDGFKAHVEAAALRLAPSLHEAAPDGDSVILLCVKGGATAAAAREIAQVCKPGTTVVSLQNGVDNVERIQANAPQMQVLAGMVPYNVVMQDGHHVHRATTGSLQIGRRPDGLNALTAGNVNAPGAGNANAPSANNLKAPSALSAQIASRFNASGLPTELSDNMRAVQWGKLLLNLNNPVNALSDLPLQAQLQDRDYRRVLADLQGEALAVLARAGIAPAKVAAVAPRVLPHLLRLPNWLFTRVAARMLRMDAQARSSMWNDLQQGRTTEIDDLCGAVVRLARAHGGSGTLNAPLNQRMCELMAQHKAGHRLSGLQMRKALSVN